MKIQIMSDLHHEIDVMRVKPTDADVIVLAGDIVGASDPSRLIPIIERFEQPIIYITGNHEYYGRKDHRTIEDVTNALRRIEERYAHFHFLDCGSFDVGDYRFLGCTLWSDFELADNVKAFCQMLKDGIVINNFRQSIADFSQILRTPNSLFTPQDLLALNYQHREFLKSEIKKSDKKIVVVTHFCPHVESIAKKYQGDVFNPYFASDCSSLMRSPVKLWIHGHTHESFDYHINDVRIVCNPRGYFTSNEQYKSKLTVEV
jgi:predicted phosphodiesterase